MNIYGFIVLFLALVSCSVVQGLSQVEIDALKEIQTLWSPYDWVGEPSCENWYGIKCNDEGHVSILQLVNIQNSGQIIPEAIGGLHFLHTLSLRLNGLRGGFPEAFRNMINLTSLDLGANKLDLPLPSWIGEMKSLRSLILDTNRIPGTIPDSLGELQSLTSLEVNGNLLRGEIPESFSHLTNLQIISVYENTLSGPIPDLRNMTQLRMAMFFRNMFDELPDTFFELTKLIHLDVSRNAIEGALPASLGHTNVTWVDFSVNFFEFTIPSSYAQLKHFDAFDVSHNNFHGDVPVFMNDIDFDYCNLRKSGFTCEVVIEQCQMDRVCSRTPFVKSFGFYLLLIVVAALLILAFYFLTKRRKGFSPYLRV